MNASENDRTPRSGICIHQQIRWGDQDAMGHVNNAVYFQYCESARIAYGDALDLERFRAGSHENLGMVAANLNFRRQLHYPGDVEVTANATRIGTKSFTLAYAIRELSTGEVAADGESVCVWVDYEQARALPLPAALVDAICELEQNPDLAAGTK